MTFERDGFLHIKGALKDTSRLSELLKILPGQGIVPIDNEPTILPILSDIIATSGVISLLGKRVNVLEVVARIGITREVKRDWHQDFQFYKNRVGITVWFPLTPCGVRSPGLQFLMPRPGYARIREPLPREGVKIAANAFTAALATNRAFAPPYEVGDVAVFDGYTPHCTYSNDTMTEARTSVEFRIV